MTTRVLAVPIWLLALGSALMLAVLAPGPAAQSYADLTMVRDQPSPFASVLQVRAGVAAGLASDEEPTIGLEDEIGWDGHVYFHTDRFADREAVLEAYAGRDGAYLGVLEGGLLGDQAQGRLEVTARYFPFYREGFYRGGDFVAAGRYEGFDWGAALMVAQSLAETARLELGPFYRRVTFDTNSQTESFYTIPDDHNAYGVRAYFEHNEMSLDRVTGRPRQGFILTLMGEREQNDSSIRFGRQGQFESSLPSGLWRARGHLEWYVPQSDVGTWTLRVDGQLTDDQDRVYNFDAQKPPGHIWVDGQVGFRLDFGQALSLTPFALGQFVRVVSESGVGSDQETFFGGGLDARVDFGDSFALLGHYSYLSNTYRPPVSTSRDTFGEHQLLLALEVRFMAQRR